VRAVSLRRPNLTNQSLPVDFGPRPRSRGGGMAPVDRIRR
jgi:hypothetical protein